MTSKECIQELVRLSVKKLHVMKEKSQLLEDERHFTESESVTELGAIEQIKGVLEEKLLALDIEFLKFYGHVLEREGITNIAEIDVSEHPSLADLKGTIEKVRELERRIGTSESELDELRLQHGESLSGKLRIKKQGARIVGAYKAQMQGRKTGK